MRIVPGPAVRPEAEGERILTFYGQRILGLAT